MLLRDFPDASAETEHVMHVSRVIIIAKYVFIFFLQIYVVRSGSSSNHKKDSSDISFSFKARFILCMIKFILSYFS